MSHFILFSLTWQEKAGELIGRLVATVGDPGETMRLFGPDALLPVSGSFVYVKVSFDSFNRFFVQVVGIFLSLPRSRLVSIGRCFFTSERK